MKTVKEVAQISGVSIRTLRYYDEIGLLKPTALTEGGYRLYDNKALEKLQHIMFFRELEIPLVEIRAIMDNPDFDREQVLLEQKSLLEKRRNRLNGLIELISDVAKGVNTMSFEKFTETDVEEIIENMRNNMTQEQFEEYLKQYGGGSIEACEQILKNAMNEDKTNASMNKWYGSKDKVIEGLKPILNMDELRVELDKTYKGFFDHIGKAGDEEEKLLVARLADLYKQMLNMDNVRNFLIDLSNEYLQNEKLAQAQDSQYGVGTSKHIAEALQRFYGV